MVLGGMPQQMRPQSVLFACGRPGNRFHHFDEGGSRRHRGEVREQQPVQIAQLGEREVRGEKAHQIREDGNPRDGGRNRALSAVCGRLHRFHVRPMRSDFYSGGCRRGQRCGSEIGPKPSMKHLQTVRNMRWPSCISQPINPLTGADAQRPVFPSAGREAAAIVPAPHLPAGNRFPDSASGADGTEISYRGVKVDICTSESGH